MKTISEHAHLSGVLITCRLDKCPESNKRGSLNKGVEVEFFHVYYIKTVLGADFSEKPVNMEALIKHVCS